MREGDTLSLSKGWKEVKFGDVVEFPPKIKMSKGSKYPFIPMELIDGGYKYVKPIEEKELSGGGAKFEEGDTLFARITPCLQNGKIAQAKNLNDKPGFGSTEYFIFRGIPGITDNDFVYYLSQMKDFRDNAINSMVGASGRQRADAGHVRSFVFNLPPLPTQQRIAEILSGYDDLIENNLKRIKILEEMAQQTYEEWFVRMRFPGASTPLSHQENSKITDTATETERSRSLPEGWEKVKLSDLMDIEGGTQPPKSQWKDDLEEGYVRMIQIRDYYTSSHIAYVLDKKVKKCNKYDIMIARYGASVGRICYGLEGAYNVALVKVIPARENYIEFLRWYLKSDSFQSTLIGMSQRTAQDGFNKDTFNGIQIIKPTSDILDKYQKYAVENLDLIFNLQNQNQRLREARDILLPRLMMGMIAV